MSADVSCVTHKNNRWLPQRRICYQCGLSRATICISNYELNKVLSRENLYMLSTALSAGPSVFTGSNQFSDWRKAASVHYRYPMRSQGCNVSLCGIPLMLVKAIAWEALV